MNSETVPPTAVDPFANQPHAIVERDGVRYTLLGPARMSKDSVSAVRAANASDEFDAVAVELDAQRLQALVNLETPAKLYVVKVTREATNRSDARRVGKERVMNCR